MRRGAALFNGLGDKSRLAIVLALSGGEKRVTDLIELLGLAQGTVSGHLACLRDCGLVTACPQDRQMFYSLAHPQLLDLLKAAEDLLALTGVGVHADPFGDLLLGEPGGVAEPPEGVGWGVDPVPHGHLLSLGRRRLNIYPSG